MLFSCSEAQKPGVSKSAMSESAISPNTLTVRLVSPSITGDERSVYITGNFNDWNPADEASRMHSTSEGGFEIQFGDISTLPDTLEYKFTRGGWEEAEIDAYGNQPPNRRISKNAGLTNDTVAGWKTGGRFHHEQYRPLINTISESFEIPQLIKTRRITALLPYNYYNTDQRYPVLYLQDGQNLFDDHAPFGSWELDKRLAFLAERGLGDFIVIAIDHAEEERLAEFNPSVPTSRLGKGDGRKYARFLTETLKPYIDSHFRTMYEPEHTGIGGSSMGGLISIYAAMEHPEVYSRLLLFSPSFWVTPALPSRFIDEATAFEGRIYIYGGGKETEALVGRLESFKKKIDAASGNGRNISAKLSINPDGTHSESEWSREFPMAAEWLFGRD